MQLPLAHSVAAIQYQECLSGHRQVSSDGSLQLKVKVHFCRNEKVHFVEMSKTCYYKLPAAGGQLTQSRLDQSTQSKFGCKQRDCQNLNKNFVGLILLCAIIKGI